VGILVPPGNRTLIVVRPRALNIDLVLIRPERENGTGPGFMEMTRQQAGVDAQKLALALVHWANGGTGAIEPVPAADRDGCWVQAAVETFSLIACERVPGQPYRPKLFATMEEAEQTADELRALLCPPPDANQELYTNLSQFGR
jgi:hypothetical protein